MHRDTYIAVLRGALPYGEKGPFATRVGLTPQYLSYLLDHYDHRVPSPQTATTIAYNLPLPPTQKHALAEHMILASESRQKARCAINLQLFDRPLDDFLQELRALNHLASFASDPRQSRDKYRLLRDATSLFLQSLDMRSSPLAVIELCLMAHEAETVLNRQVDAVYHATTAEFIADELVNLRQLPSSQRSRFLDFRINAPRLRAVSYSNLGWFKGAINYCEKAEELLSLQEFKHRSDFWKPHLYRDKINALRGKPRYALTTAEGLVDQVADALATGVYSPREAELLSFLIHSSLVRTYLKHGTGRSLKKAEHVLNAQLDPTYELEYIGPLHQTTLLRTWASFCQRRGDPTGWQYFINRALETALTAGLRHQADQIHAQHHTRPA